MAGEDETETPFTYAFPVDGKDPELHVMQIITQAFETAGLNTSARQRVLNWAMDRNASLVTELRPAFPGPPAPESVRRRG